MRMPEPLPDIQVRLAAVALPHGATADVVHFSVALFPRLSGADRLASYDDWLHWTTSAAAGTTVDLDVGGVAVLAPVDTSGFDPGLWDAIFGSGDASVATFAMAH